jgi:hypothetical protein
VEGNARLGLDLGDCDITDAFGAPVEIKDTTELEVTPFPLYIRHMDASPAWQRLLAAYDAQQIELKKRREQAVACRKYLYDFGTADRVGETLLEGIKFQFAPVNAASTWNEAKGYGFNRPAMADEYHSWVSSKLDCDGCRLGSDMQFRFRVEPGAYRLSLGISPFSDTGTVMIEGLKESVKMVVSKTTGLAETDQGYSEIRWLSLIEKH